jgi:D-beta-D-heptose 7-phosphate kinase/D-beta-D-heptose 1-phosphate adenosyltransferase
MAQHNLAIVSGGFDPVHVGHVRMLWEASLYNTRVVVILNNDNWLLEKKGFVFMPQDEREEILKHFRGVYDVVLSSHLPGTRDMSVCKDLEILSKRYSETLGFKLAFCNGGDRKEGCLPSAEEQICEELGIKMLYGVGGDKIQSSSKLVERAKGNVRTVLEL